MRTTIDIYLHHVEIFGQRQRFYERQETDRNPMNDRLIKIGTREAFDC